MAEIGRARLAGCWFSGKSKLGVGARGVGCDGNLQIKHADLRRLAATHSGMADAFWRDCVADVSIFSEWVANVGRRDALSRLAHLFCKMAIRCDEAGQGVGTSFPDAETQADLGDATGLTAIQFNRTLRVSKANGIADLRAGTVTIHDWAPLASVDDFDSAFLSLEGPSPRIADAVQLLYGIAGRDLLRASVSKRTPPIYSRAGSAIGTIEVSGRFPAMRRLVYISRSLMGADPGLVDELVEYASEHNGAEGVTGMLWSDSSFFAQALEGEHEAIEALMQRIRADPRHTDIEVVLDCAAGQRMFGTWAMARPGGGTEDTAITAFLVGLALKEDSAASRRLRDVALAADG